MKNSANILLLGKTGAGKSSFINYFLGKEVAAVDYGRPVTQEYFIPYEVEGGKYPVEIFDTKGIESMGAQGQLDLIADEVKRRNNSDDVFDWFHTIFYCVSMADPRFEDFEADLIRRLNDELSQHIHIIITNCDYDPENVGKMRGTIREKLGKSDNIEIFEVVSVRMEMLDGTVAEPYGKEEVSKRVFERLAEDITYRLSREYANAMWGSLTGVADDIFAEIDAFVDETVKLTTLGRFIKDPNEATEYIKTRVYALKDRFEGKIADVQREADQKFMDILQPAAELYNSYWGVVTGSFAKDVGLSFADTVKLCDTGWLKDLAEHEFLEKILPNLGKHVTGGKVPGENTVPELLKLAISGKGNVFNLKKNIKGVVKSVQERIMKQSIPAKEKIAEEAYNKIMEYITNN